MAKAKRATVYLEPALHRALLLKAAENERSMSSLVNDAVRSSLGEDATDVAAFKTRAKEPSLSFDELLKDLRHRGKL